MKTKLIIGVTLMLAVLSIGFGAMVAIADGPVANAGLNNVPYIDNQTHTITPNQFVLYRFDYILGDPTARPLPLTTIKLVNGYNSGLNFEVWTPETVTDMMNNHFIGRGSPERMRCATTETNDTGWCNTGDMIWVGAFGSSGTYYVRIVTNNVFNPILNNNVNNSSAMITTSSAPSLGARAAPVVNTPTPTLTVTATTTATSTPTATASSSSSSSSATSVATASATTASSSSSASTTVTNTTTAGGISYKLLITGDAVRLGGSPIAVTGPSSNSLPSSTSPGSITSSNTQTSAMNDDPSKAAVIDGKLQTIAANSASWFRYDTGVSNDNSRVVKTITLVNGNQPGIGFEVWTKNELTDWWNNTPVGRGTAASMNCDTGQIIGQGTCQSKDLTWSGAFNPNTTVYVRIVNNTGKDFTPVLTVQ